MPWLPMYLNQDDLIILSEWLNSEPNIALIKSVGEGKWQAFRDFEITKSGRYCLFHTLSGPLPLLAKNHGEPDAEIPNPFAGWQENRPGGHSNRPYFGAGHPAIFWLSVSFKRDETILRSYFEWIGNHYAQIGSPAPDVAKKWWERLRRWVRKQSVAVPRGKNGRKKIYAFKNAVGEFESGAKYGL